MSGFASFVRGTWASISSTFGFQLLCHGQKCLVYPSGFPPFSQAAVSPPSRIGLKYEDLRLETPDKVTIRSYLLLHSDKVAATRPTVLMFHGNAMNYGDVLCSAWEFYVTMQCNVFILSYRGYGNSKGTPSEKGIRIDAQTALDYITSHPTLKLTPIILYGQSLGGAVAIDLASRNPSVIRGVILENTFTSLPRVVSHIIPLLKHFSFICTQKWDSASKIPLIPSDTPILMLSGSRDHVVPPEHMRALWDIVVKQRGGQVTPQGNEVGLQAAVGISKFLEFEWGVHNNTSIQEGYWPAVAEWVSLLCRS